MRTVGFLVIGLVTVAALAAPAEGQIYTWRDANGTLVLSDRPMSPDAETAAVPGSTRIRTTRRVSTLTRAGSYDRIIERYAARYGVRPDLVRAVIQVESAFDPNARSSKGAMGLMQLMPQTATEMGVINPYDPEQNVRGGVAYLQRLLDHYDGDEELALAAYNAGPGAVERHGNQIPPFPETQNYVEKIRSTTDLGSAGRGETIYKSFEEVDGRRVPVYTNIKPASEDYEVATRPR